MKQKTKKQSVVISIIIAAILLVFAAADKFGWLTFEDLAGRNANDSGELEVYYIDVGQGDSSLIVFGDDTLLIDAGDNGYGDDVAVQLVSLGINKIDTVMATHPDADHIGGMKAVFEKFEISQFIMPELPDSEKPTTKTYQNLLNAIADEGCKVEYAKAGYSWEIGEATATILSPFSDKYDSVNNYSAITLIEYGDTNFLFTGDAEKQSEAQLLKNNANLNHVDVLKAGHHGASNSTSKELLDRLTPDFAVISVGKDNSYGHPTDQTLENLSKYTKNIYRTDLHGTIIIKSDGKTLKFDIKK